MGDQDEEQENEMKNQPEDVTILIDDSGLKSSSIIFEQDVVYTEPYMEELIDVTAAIQTDLTLNGSNSLSSLPSIPQDNSEGCRCSVRAEIPWQNITLPKPGTYVIAPTSRTKIQTTADQAVISEKDEAQDDEKAAQEEGGGEGEGEKEEEEEEEEEEEKAQVAENEGQSGNEPPTSVLNAEQSENQDVEQGGDNMEAETEQAEDEGEHEDINVNEDEMPENVRNMLKEEGEEGEDVPEDQLEESEIQEQHQDEEGVVEEREDQGGDEGQAEGEDAQRREQTADSENEEDFEEAREMPQEEKPLAVKATDEVFILGPHSYVYDSSTDNKYLESYMETLLKMFPDEAEEELTKCDSHTEIPWGDILLPTNCRIKTTRKASTVCCARQCVAAKMSTITDDKQQQLPQQQFANSFNNTLFNDDNVIEIEIHFPEKPSNVVPVAQGAASQATVSMCSAVSGLQVPRRCHKEFIFQVTVEDNTTQNISYKDARGEMQPLMFGSELRATNSLPFTVSALHADEKSSIIINIKPSSECPYESEFIPVPGNSTNAKELPKFKEPTEVKSCTATCDAKGSGCKTTPKASFGITNKSSASVPHMQSGCSMNKQKKESVQQVFYPGKCSCKDAEKPNTFKADPVMAALEAYESEMKPLRKALTELQQKIRNLDLPEMKGCCCTTMPSNKSNLTTMNKTTLPSPPTRATPCSSYQPPVYKKPSPPSNYYNFPPLNVPSYMPNTYYTSFPQPCSGNTPVNATNSYALQPDFSGKRLSRSCQPTSQYPRSNSPAQSKHSRPPKSSCPRFTDASESPRYLLQSVLSSRELIDDNSEVSSSSCGCHEDTDNGNFNDDEFVCPFMEIVRSMAKEDAKGKSKKNKHQKMLKYECAAACAGLSKDEEYRAGKSLKTDPQSFGQFACPSKCTR